VGRIDSNTMQVTHFITSTLTSLAPVIIKNCRLTLFLKSQIKRDLVVVKGYHIVRSSFWTQKLAQDRIWRKRN